MNVVFKDLGIRDYKETWDLQLEVHNSLKASKHALISEDVTADECDTRPHIFFVEHPHVYTLGKSGSPNNLLVNKEFMEQINATYYHIERGGDITYHGPGQLVGYPIIDLEKLNLSVKKYIWLLEESVIETIKDYGIYGERREGSIGVWLETNTPRVRKICAIGVKVSRYITLHGFALNVNTDLKYFNYINPCGFTDSGVTSISNETGKIIDMHAVKENLLNRLLNNLSN